MLKFRHAAATLPVTIGLLAGLAQPAAAADLMPYLSVSVVTVPGGFRACAEGEAEAGVLLVSRWEFTLAGAREDGSRITGSAVRDAAMAFGPYCVTVMKGAPQHGGFTATLSYVVTGNQASTAVVGTGTWNPVEGDRTSGMHTCPDTGCTFVPVP